jgi:hypothetical protein
MKMLKKGLFAIALLGLFAVSAQAICTTYNVSLTNTGGNGWVKIDPNTDSGFNTGFSLGTWYKQWPGTVTVCTNYTAIDLCCIPVYLEVGMYAEVYQCGNQKIILKQVPCTQITSFPQGVNAGNAYPCYVGCTNVGVRGNFPMLLGLKKDNLGGDPNAAQILPTSNWSAKYVPAQAGYGGPQPGTNFVPAGVAVINSGNNATVPPGLPGGANSYYLTAICVQAWKANLMYNLFSNPGMSGGITLLKVGNVCITVQPQ